MDDIKNVLKNDEWFDHLTKHNLQDQTQLSLYNCTHRYTAIYKLGGYYFTFGMRRGYRNLTALKRLI